MQGFSHCNVEKNFKKSGPYWLVRKALVIIAFFGGLRHTEVMSLVLGKISIGQEGVYVVHQRDNKIQYN